MSCLLIYGAVLLAQREILPVGRINILLTRLIRRAPVLVIYLFD